MAPGADVPVTLLYYLYLSCFSTIPSLHMIRHYLGIPEVCADLSCLVFCHFFLSGCSTPQHPFSSRLPRSLGFMFILLFFSIGVLDDLGFLCFIYSCKLSY